MHYLLSSAISLAKQLNYYRQQQLDVAEWIEELFAADPELQSQLAHTIDHPHGLWTRVDLHRYRQCCRALRPSWKVRNDLDALIAFTLM